MSILERNCATFPVVDGDDTITMSPVGTVRSSVPTKGYDITLTELFNGESVADNHILAVFTVAIGARKEVLWHEDS